MKLKIILPCDCDRNVPKLLLKSNEAGNISADMLVLIIVVSKSNWEPEKSKQRL